MPIGAGAKATTGDRRSGQTRTPTGRCALPQADCGDRTLTGLALLPATAEQQYVTAEHQLGQSLRLHARGSAYNTQHTFPLPAY